MPFGTRQGIEQKQYDSFTFLLPMSWQQYHMAWRGQTHPHRMVMSFPQTTTAVLSPRRDSLSLSYIRLRRTWSLVETVAIVIVAKHIILPALPRKLHTSTPQDLACHIPWLTRFLSEKSFCDITMANPLVSRFSAWNLRELRFSWPSTAAWPLNKGTGQWQCNWRKLFHWGLWAETDSVICLGCRLIQS